MEPSQRSQRTCFTRIVNSARAAVPKPVKQFYSKFLAPLCGKISRHATPVIVNAAKAKYLPLSDPPGWGKEAKSNEREIRRLENLISSAEHQVKALEFGSISDALPPLRRAKSKHKIKFKGNTEQEQLKKSIQEFKKSLQVAQQHKSYLNLRRNTEIGARLAGWAGSVVVLGATSIGPLGLSIAKNLIPGIEKLKDYIPGPKTLIFLIPGTEKLSEFIPGTEKLSEFIPGTETLVNLVPKPTEFATSTGVRALAIHSHYKNARHLPNAKVTSREIKKARLRGLCLVASVVYALSMHYVYPVLCPDSTANLPCKYLAKTFPYVEFNYQQSQDPDLISINVTINDTATDADHVSGTVP